ncbi:hypothetical protein HYV86_07140 [Candidatus Woesearchaeota archaeon]|nr:hypothetical protein [Candidatus Woesearchaeota archaeon]
MLDYKVIIGTLAVIIGIVSYIPYFRGIFKGKTKPHAFSWFVWAVVGGIAFAAQVVKGGGAGAWVTALTVFACLIVAAIGLFKGKRDFPIVDWLCLIASFVAIGIWAYTNDPTYSIILITLTDTVAFIPTFRKAYHQPHEETITTFAMSSLKWFVALFALENFVFVNWFYTGSMIVTNALFVTMVLIRRKKNA